MSSNLRSGIANKRTVPKNAGTVSKPTGAIQKPTGAIQKPTGAVPKPTSAGIPKPIRSIPKPTGTIPKPTSTGIPKTTIRPTSAVSTTGVIPKKIIRPASAISTTVTVPKATGIPKSPGLVRKSPVAVPPTSGVAIPKYLRTAPRYPNLVSKTSGIASKSPGNAPTYTAVDPTNPNIVITNPTLSPTIPNLPQEIPVIAPKSPGVPIKSPSVIPRSPGTSLPRYTGTVPKSKLLASIATTSPSPITTFVDSSPTFNASSVQQSVKTPTNVSRSPIEFTKETEQIINECIENGLTVVETIRSQSNELSPLLRKALTKVNKGTQAAISFKDTISKVNTAIATGNKEQILQDFEIVMQDVHEMSRDNMLHLSEVIYSIYISKLKSSFQETDVELNEILVNTKDGKTRELIGWLIGRNQIIINALIYVSNMIPEVHKNEREKIKADGTELINVIASEITPEGNNSLSNSRRLMNASGMAKKLFILGESLDIPKGTQVENTQIEVRLQSETNKPPTPRKDGKYRDRLSGFMRSENGEMEEVLLVLKEHIKEPETASPNKLPNDKPKMMAFIDHEMLEFDEVSYLPQKPKTNIVVALVEDEETKETHEVQMTLVPKSPNESADGNIIALIPYSSPISFLDSSSDISLIGSSFEGESTSFKSRNLLKKAKLLKSKLLPKTPRTKKVIGTPNFKSLKFPGQSEQNQRPPLKKFDDWMSEINMNDDSIEPLGPDDYQDVLLDLPEEDLSSKIPQSQLMIEQGKILCKSMQNDLEIIKVIDAVRFPNQTTPEKQNTLSHEDTERMKEAENLRQMEHDAIQELIKFLQPSELSILRAANVLTSSPNNSSLLHEESSPNQSSIEKEATLESTLATQLDQIITTSAALREQLEKSLDEMVKEIENSDDPIPEYERALRIARLKKDAMKREILESLQGQNGTNDIMVALVENPQTGEREQILVDLVPTDPLNTSAGRIVGFLDDFESEAMPEFAPRSMDYSFSEKLTPGKVKALPYFATPPRVEESHKSEKRRSLHHTDSRAPKTTDFGFTKSVFDQNIIANEPDLFEEELELVNEPMSGYDQAAFIAKKMRDELEQILLAKSPTKVEEEPPFNTNNVDPLRRRQLFFDPLLPSNPVQQQQQFAQVPQTQRFMDESSFALQPLSQSLDEPGQSQYLAGSQHTSPIRSMLQSPIQSGQNPIDHVEQLVTLVNPGQALLDNQTQQILISLGSQNPNDQFSQLLNQGPAKDLLTLTGSVRPNQNQQNILQEIVIPMVMPLNSNLGSELNLGVSGFLSSNQIEQLGQVFPNQSIPTYNVSKSPNQSSQDQMGYHQNSKLLSPGQQFFQPLPAAQELIDNESIPLYESPDHTLDSVVYQPVINPSAQYEKLLNKIAGGEFLVDQIQPFI
ncbi:unnamed protein product [Diamesa hyperborea]